MGDFYFCTFADSSLMPSLKRIKSQAKALGVFKEIFLYTEKNLPDFAKENINKIIELSGTKRGYGFWSWKPAIIKDVLQKINEGDYVVYCDAGSHVNKNAKDKFFEYAKKVDTYDVLVTELTGLTDAMWTKMDTINLFKDRIDFTNKNNFQLAATNIFLKKNSYTENLIEEYNDLMSFKNLHYFDDSPSVLQNAPEFKENRHDQSILSLLLKTGHYYTTPVSESWAEDKAGWDALINGGGVFLHLRDKQKSFVAKIKDKFNKMITRG